MTGEFPHKWPVTWKMFPFDDVIMLSEYVIAGLYDDQQVNAYSPVLFSVLCTPNDMSQHDCNQSSGVFKIICML